MTLHLMSNRILRYIGKRTLPIYMLQGIVIAASRVLITRIRLNGTYGIISLFICTVTGVIVPLLIYEARQKLFKFDFIFTPTKYIKF